MSKQEKRSQVSQQEDRVNQFWQANKIFKQSVDREAPQGPYSFYDGPPFATGTPHYGHLTGSIIKDVIPRYYTMRGYQVKRRWGWDCHGLPIENIVEKELGISKKKEIEEIGVAKFNDTCRARVLAYATDWQETISRLGRWVDMDNPYRTMDLDFMESVWWIFKTLWDQDLIYQDHRSMHVCPRCETTLAQSEVAEGYRTIKDLSATVKFALEGEENTFVLAWTTTPWTLIANVALAIGAEIKYSKVEFAGSYYILASDKVETVFAGKDYKLVAELSAKDLVGKKYQALFPYYQADKSLANYNQGWQIYLAGFVNTEEGTGVVHIAPAFGEDDLALAQKHQLPLVQHVSLDGQIKAEATDFAGLNVKPAKDHMSTDVEIIKYLSAHDTLFAKAKYEHSYPHCWRCDTPLINYATSSWFVAVTKIKDRLINNAQEINWFPSHIKAGRFGKWLEGARDWSISRQRYWASAIPIWECESCSHRQVIGSVAELEELSGVMGIDDIHKDKVDPITFPCSKCQKTMRRVPDVLDCWFESGAMPLAQFHYPFANKAEAEASFPAQFIAEGVDQTRTWFYYLSVIATALKDSHAFSNVIANGIVLAEDGKKMSKRLLNYPDPVKVLDQYGADALRMYLLASPVMSAENFSFSEKGVMEALRKNIFLLENIYNFFALHDYTGPEESDLEHLAKASDNVLDKWLIINLNQLIKTVDKYLEEYNLAKATRLLTDFIDIFSTWYIRRSRDRFKDLDASDGQLAWQITKQTLVTITKIMAPFMPFLAERLWQTLTGNDYKQAQASVHLEAWPQAFSVANEEEVLRQMELTRQIVELGLAKRDQAGIRVRQMLAKLEVSSPESLEPAYLELIKDEVNLQEISFKVTKDQTLSVVLDTTITAQLKEEGLKRELIRFINRLRKQAELTKADKATILVSGSEAIALVVKKYQAELQAETSSALVEYQTEIEAELESKLEAKIEAEMIIIALKK